MLLFRNGQTLLITSVALLALFALPVWSEGQQFEYAAKFMCGTPSPTDAARLGFAAFGYATAINIHNPNTDPAAPPVVFVKKAVRARPQGFEPIPPSALVQETVRSNFAVEVDCQNILELGIGAGPLNGLSSAYQPE